MSKYMHGVFISSDNLNYPKQMGAYETCNFKKK
jgi:hypothetical protein